MTYIDGPGYVVAMFANLFPSEPVSGEEAREGSGSDLTNGNQIAKEPVPELGDTDLGFPFTKNGV